MKTGNERKLKKVIYASTLKCVYKHIPVLKWFPKYNWKSYILLDIISGMTVAIMHIPQGMAYAILADVPPIHGIYMAVFPVLVYFMFSTSRHISVGTFAVICLMTGEIIQTVVKNGANVTSEYNEVQVGAVVSFMTGVWHLVFFCLRLGIIRIILSGTLVTSFTTGAAVHVFSSQVKNLLGLQVKTKPGLFGLYFSYKEIIIHIKETHGYTTLISAITIIILLFDTYVLQKRLRKISKFVFPTQLIIMITATAISELLHLEKCGIRVIQNVPKGFPAVGPPPLSLLHEVAVGSVFITFVSYSVSMSVALLYSTKNQYRIDANQELLAFGLANIAGSFFQCLPVSTSLGRSTVQVVSGGKTQVVSIVSCLILLIVLLLIGPLFEPLPTCVLSSIIVVALLSTLSQVKLIPQIWKLSKLETAVWIVTFLSVIIFEIKYGLLVGIILTLIQVFIRSMKPDVWLMGTVKINKDNAKENQDYSFLHVEENVAIELSGIKIIRISEGLSFSTVSHIRTKIYALSGVDPHEILKLKNTMKKEKATSEDINEAVNVKLTVNFKLQTQDHFQVQKMKPWK